jgi:dethiobiotin synthase
MTRLFVTGTDTDVGKTRVTAALAAACVARGERPTIVKAVQTGLAPGIPGDAAEAGALAGCAALELARFGLAADPWSAALAEAAPPLDAAALAARIEALAGPAIVEGAGGAAVPINATETLADVAVRTSCAAVVVTGLRLGCISHTLLTLEYLGARGIPVRGVVLVERWRVTAAEDRTRVERAIATRATILGLIEHDLDAARSVARAAALLGPSLAPSTGSGQVLDKVGTRD